MDNGECAAITSYESCVTKMTFFDDTVRTCEWDSEYSECYYIEPEITVSGLILITVLLSIVWLPFQITTDIIFNRILLAPTTQEIDYMNVIEKIKAVGDVTKVAPEPDESRVTGRPGDYMSSFLRRDSVVRTPLSLNDKAVGMREGFFECFAQGTQDHGAHTCRYG